MARRHIFVKNMFQVLCIFVLHQSSCILFFDHFTLSVCLKKQHSIYSFEILYETQSLVALSCLISISLNPMIFMKAQAVCHAVNVNSFHSIRFHSSNVIVYILAQSHKYHQNKNDICHTARIVLTRVYFYLFPLHLFLLFL